MADPVPRLPIDPPPLAAPGRTVVPFVRVAGSEPVAGGLAVRVVDAADATHVLRLTPWAPGVLRVQFRADATVPELTASPVLLTARPEALAIERVTDGDGVGLAAPGLRVRVRRDPFHLSVSDADATVRLAGQILDRTMLDWVSPPTGTWRDADGAAGVHETLELKPDEAIVGLGETHTGLDQRGRRRVLWGCDPIGLNTTDLTYKPIPFWLSSRGYGCLVHRPERTVVDIGACSTVTLALAVAAPEMDYFVFLGSPREILARYTVLTGRAPILPRWALGVWMSRCMYRDRAEVEAVVEGMRRRDLPLDVVHLDPLWLAGRASRVLDSCDFVWDEQAFPDPAGFVAWLRERGVRLSLWENPWVPRGSGMWDEGIAKGFLARAPDGTPATSTTNPDGAVVDFTNPAAAEWFAARHRPLFALGVACFKTDYGESVPEDARFASGETGAQVHNLYPLLYNRTVFDATRAATGTGLVFARSAAAGSQRYPVHWSGDAQATWGGMAGALRAGLGFACSGGAVWAHDIGGFWNPDAFAPPSPRLYVRWAQFGLLSPVARFHGTTPREPWEFGEEAVTIVREFARLRSRLVPYLEACLREATATGLPVLRPALLDFPEDPLAWRVDLQYLLGPLLLVAPFFDDGVERSVYLPEGRWWDWWDDRAVDGGRMVRVTAPLERVPLFVRGDSVLPLAPPPSHPGAGAWDPLLLEIRGRPETVVTVPDGDATVTVRLVPADRDLLLEIEPAIRRLTLRVCGSGGVPAVDVEAGSVACGSGRDQRGAVVTIAAPRGGRLRLRGVSGRISP